MTSKFDRLSKAQEGQLKRMGANPFAPKPVGTSNFRNSTAKALEKAGFVRIYRESRMSPNGPVRTRVAVLTQKGRITAAMAWGFSARAYLRHLESGRARDPEAIKAEVKDLLDMGIKPL